MNDFESYANEKLDSNARCKYCFMEPDAAGKLDCTVDTGETGSEKCDIYWESQEDCTEDDCCELIEAFVEYYKEQVEGNTYKLIMKSRSYDGHSSDGFYIKLFKVVNGKPEYMKPEPKVYFDDELKLGIWWDGWYDDTHLAFRLLDETDDVEGTGSTIAEAAKGLIEVAEEFYEYISLPAGYEIVEDKIEFDLPDGLSEDTDVSDYYDNLSAKDKKDFEENSYFEIKDKSNKVIGRRKLLINIK